jgi:hypothetical protein
VYRTSRTRHPDAVPGWGSAPSWGQPFPGWSPLVDHGPLGLRAANSIARWWWPILALAGFAGVASFVLGHDHPWLVRSGLVALALAALVVVLLTIHRAAGPGPLIRAVAEYAIVAILTGLLVADISGVDQPPANPTRSAAKTEAKQATGKPMLQVGQDRPGVLRVAAGVTRVVTKAIRAVIGAAGWFMDLWRQADQQTDRRRGRSPTTTATGDAMPRSPTPWSMSTRRSL